MTRLTIPRRYHRAIILAGILAGIGFAYWMCRYGWTRPVCEGSCLDQFMFRQFGPEWVLVYTESIMENSTNSTRRYYAAVLHRGSDTEYSLIPFDTVEDRDSYVATYPTWAFSYPS